MNELSVKQIIIFLVLSSVFIVFLVVNDDDDFKYKKNKLSNIKIEGIVSKKFLDYKNHSAETIIINSKKKIILHREISGLFYYIENGDSIFKPKNSLKITLFNHHYDPKVFILNFK